MRLEKLSDKELEKLINFEYSFGNLVLPLVLRYLRLNGSTNSNLD